MRLIEMTESYLGIIRTMISKLTLLVGLYKRDLFFLVTEVLARPVARQGTEGERESFRGRKNILG